MTFLRLPFKDPRTLSRDIPGFSEILFPGLVPGLVAGLNRSRAPMNSIEKISDSLFRGITIAPAMMYEIAYARAEMLVQNEPLNREAYLQKAFAMQSKYFDAVIPAEISPSEEILINKASENLSIGLNEILGDVAVEVAPRVPGLEWISSSKADFSFSDTLVEVKFIAKNFTSSDYRQLLLYWLLNFAYSLEHKECKNWSRGVLFNPRQAIYVEVDLLSFHNLVSGGRNIIETVELLKSVVSSARAKLN